MTKIYRRNSDRAHQNLNDLPQDKIADSRDEIKIDHWDRGLGGVADIEVGPGGYLYTPAYQGRDGYIIDEQGHLLTYTI